MEGQEMLESEIESVVNQPDKASVPDEPAKFKIDNEEYTIEQLKEFRNGYLRNSDYTKKTQELSKQRNEVKELMEVKQFLAQHPEKFEAVKNILDETDQLQQKEEKGNISSKEAERLEDLELKIAEMDLKSKYKDIDAKTLNAVERYAVINNLNLEEAYKQYKSDEEVRTKELEQKILENLQKRGKLKTESFGGKSSGSPATDVTKLNWSAIGALAEKEMD